MGLNINTTNNIEEAYLYAAEKHAGQKRKFSDMPYMIHPELVTCIIVNYTEDKDILQAALLHDTVEDTDATLDEIGELFGERVRNLVDEVTNDQGQIEILSKKVYMSMLFNSISSDALLIKLVDRLHNVLSLIGNKEIPFDFVKRYNEETSYVLDNLNRKLNEQHKEIINALQLVVNFIELQYIYDGWGIK